VAISGDGMTLATYGTNGVWVFINTGNLWLQQGPVLVGSINGVHVNISDPAYGYAVSLSEDGNTLAMGWYTPFSYTPATVRAAFVFVRTNGVWSQQGPVLWGSTTSIGVGGVQDNFVSLSDDGNTLLLSDNRGNIYGTVWVYKRNSTNSWNQQYTITDPSYSLFGQCIAISGDASTIAASYRNAPYTVNIYTSSGASWILQGSLISDLFDFGYGGLSLTSNGNLLSIGTVWGQTVEYLYLASRTNQTWSVYSNVSLQNGGYTQNAMSSALSSDGRSLIVGGRFYNGNIGSTYTFVTQTPGPTPAPTASPTTSKPSKSPSKAPTTAKPTKSPTLITPTTLPTTSVSPTSSSSHASILFVHVVLQYGLFVAMYYVV
jgi:hypothetical protein